MKQEQTQDLAQKLIEEKDVKRLCKLFFDVDLYPTQERIVKAIVFRENKNIILNCYTRYGKTFSVGIGVALYLIINGRSLDGFRIGIVGPADDDAESVRKEMLKAGIKSSVFRGMIDTSRSNDPEDLVKSRSKDELTLCDGSISLELVSSQSGKSGDGSGARGDGFDLIVMDESNRISHTFWKESGDRLREHEDSVLVEMGNPFHKDNQFYRHWVRDDFKAFHVGEEQGIREGRHSKAWFDERAKEVGGRQSLEYQVLYNSEFPDQVDDALIAHSWLERAEKNEFSFEDPEIIYGADIAGSGDDKIVVTRMEKENGKHRLTDQWSKDKSSDTGELAHWIRDRVPESPDEVDRFVVDAVGIGAGVHSKLKELGFEPTKFKAGEKPNSEEDRFQNKKARNFFKLRDTLQENDLEICDNFQHGRGNKLVHELTHIRTERRARDKIKIVDPDSGSPDFADCYDEKTEVMTKQGWKKFDDVSYSDKIATLNPQNKELEYQQPTDIIKEDYKGKMYHVRESQQIDLMVTPNHKLYVNTGDRRYGDFKLEKAEEVKNQQMMWKKDCNWNGKKRKSFYVPGVDTVKWHEYRDLDEAVEVKMNVWLEFLGYFLSEGHVAKNRSNQVALACQPENELRDKMQECCKKMPFNFTADDRGFTFHDKRLNYYLRKLGGCNEKYIPTEIKQLCSEQLEILLEALMDGDGSRNQYYTVSERLRDDVMELALKTHKSANWSVKHEEDAEGNLGTANHDLYTVSMQENQSQPEINYKDYGAEDEWVDYNGKIYCVTVPNHIIMVRRNGKTCWSGNSTMMSFYSGGDFFIL